MGDNMSSREIVGQVTTSTDIPRVWVEDIMDTAAYGIVHWVDMMVPQDGDYMGCKRSYEVLTRGGTLIITMKYEVEDTNTVALAIDNFLEGFKMACVYYNRTPEDFYEEHDAEMADVLVQYAVFGKVVFG